MFRPMALAVFLVGCSAADSDDDGLTNKEEEELGTDLDRADSDGDGLSDPDELDADSDPLKPDSDDDGLTDGEELDLGSDPNALDSDEDGYADFDEVQEGFDPADPESRIYQGYWPYNPAKDTVDLTPWDGRSLEIGDKFGRFATGVDQFRDNLDIRDFAQRGRYIVIDASASWCVPCQNMASWLAEGAADDPYAFEEDFKKVRLAVKNDEVTWITFLTDNIERTYAPVFNDTRDWDAAFPNPRVPVVTDVENRILDSVNTEGNSLIWPSFVVLDEDLEVVYRGGGSDTLAFVRDIL